MFNETASLSACVMPERYFVFTCCSANASISTSTRKKEKNAILVPMLMPASRPFSRCNKNCALASLQWKPGLNGGLSFIMKFVLLFEFVINVIARAGALQSSTIYVLHQIQRDKIPSFQQCAYMNFPPEVKPLQSADWTNFRSDGKVACVISLDDGSVWKCKFKVNANYIWK